MGSLITYRQTSLVKLKCSLDLRGLYSRQDDLRGFKDRLSRFLDSDPYNQKIYELDGDRLRFESEQLIPKKTDHRPGLLMVFGNPASHSIEQGMFFSYEGNVKEHRFWKDIMRPSGALDLSVDLDMPIEKRNQIRKKRLLELDYESPFRIGLCVFVSLPSPPSRDWSGTSGIQKLLGKRAVALLEPYERERLIKVARTFLRKGGGVVTFHRSAWEGLRRDTDPEYSILLAKAGDLNGRLNGMPEVPLYGIPPTRLAGPCQKVLKEKLKGWR
jgi:hypothetical protein